MATAITALANVTLGANASSVTFSSISSAYRDLILVVSYTSNTSFFNMTVRFNSDSGSNYTRVNMSGNPGGATSNSGSGTSGNINYDSAGFTTSANFSTTNIFDYSATDKHKTWISRAGETTGYSTVEAIVGRWASTSAITSLVLLPSANQFASGSTFALYGVSS